MSEFQQVVKEGAQTVGRKIKRLFLYLTAALIVGFLLFVLIVSNISYSKGTRAGDLIKITYKGVVFKTYEGQLNLGGIEAGNDGITGNIWDFSVTNDEVVKQLQQLEGRKVKLHYHERYKSMPWQGKTKYFIDKAERIE